MGLVNVGVDLGQRRDPSAIAVAELEWRGERDRIDHWNIRHLERIALGTPYPVVAARVAEVVAAIKARSPRREERIVTVGAAVLVEPAVSPPTVNVYADATGVGLPAVELMRMAGVRVHAVLFTYGDRRTQDGLNITLGKGFLVSRLQALLQSDRLHLPKTAEAEATARELQDYEIHTDPDGDSKFGAFKTGAHDDLVTALGLAVHARPKTWGGHTAWSHTAG